MRYSQPVYRPPSEADSLIIQATYGCPHNKCTFCGMYKGVKFGIRKLDDIKKDLKDSADFYGKNLVRSIFFPDGNTIIMKTEQLEEIFKFSYKTFPDLKRITLYASAKILKFKTLSEYKRLKKAGLSRIHMGLESGSDKVLSKIQKGADSKTMIATGQRVKKARIELSEYVLVGIGGKSLLKDHALGTARVLNAINPDFIRLRTWVPVKNAPLYKDYQSGKFKLLSPHQALEEVKLLLENLDVKSLFLSDHISNYLNISGQLPRDKENMLKRIEKGLKTDESNFRPEIIEHL